MRRSKEPISKEYPTFDIVALGTDPQRPACTCNLFTRAESKLIPSRQTITTPLVSTLLLSVAAAAAVAIASTVRCSSILQPLCPDARGCLPGIDAHAHVRLCLQLHGRGAALRCCRSVADRRHILQMQVNCCSAHLGSWGDVCRGREAHSQIKATLARVMKRGNQRGWCMI